MFYLDNLKSGVISVMIYLVLAVISYLIPESGLAIVSYLLLATGVYRLMLDSGGLHELKISWRLLLVHFAVVVINLVVLISYGSLEINSDGSIMNFGVRFAGALSSITLFASNYFLSEGSSHIIKKQFTSTRVLSLFKVTSVSFLALCVSSIVCLFFPVLEVTQFQATIIVKLIMLVAYFLMYQQVKHAYGSGLR